MTAALINGARIARELRAELAGRVATLATSGRTPGLAVILLGEDPASRIYVRNKVKACAEVGIRSLQETYPESLAEAALLARIAALNDDPAVHGILVQMPLPRHVSPARVVAAIDARKDVDGYSIESAGRLLAGVAGFLPCTPWGCMRLIESTGIGLRGKNAVVIGRSNTVGKPMALLLLRRDATVTVCHSRTPDLAEHTRRADVVVAAVGRAKTLTAPMVKPGAVVIDVGMNRDASGRLCGDVDFDAVAEIAGAITPVPGGVGPMTIAMLLANTVLSAERAAVVTS